MVPGGLVFSPSWGGKANGGGRSCIKTAYVRVPRLSTYLAGNKPAVHFQRGQPQQIGKQEKQTNKHFGLKHFK
jgi:hypothetical protein